MSYRGDIHLGDTIDFKFTSRNAGVPSTLGGAPSVAAYVDNGTTEITAGITLTVDFDTRTGLNNVRVVATSGNGYAAGTNVDIVITSGTVGGISVVGEVVGSFSIDNRVAKLYTNNDKTGYALSASAESSVVATLFAAVSEGAETFIQTLRIIRAACAGKASGLNLLAPKYRDKADTKNRIDAVTDADGNRTSVTTDGT